MILVTNDDGKSAGLQILLSAAHSLSNACCIIPAKQQSAVAKSMTFHKALRVHQSHLGKFRIYEISGTPADAVSFALHYKPLFPKKPSLTVAGVNSGFNLSLHTIFSSGTIGACLESALNGVPAIAFSSQRHSNSWRDERNWRPQGHLLRWCKFFIKKALQDGLPRGCDMLSVNFPRKLEGASIAVCPPQRHAFSVHIERRIDPDNVPYYWMAGAQKVLPGSPDSDVSQLVRKQNITVTPISLSLSPQNALAEAKRHFARKGMGAKGYFGESRRK